MRVYIGPYKNWVGPFQIAEALCFWARKEKDEYGYEHTADWVHNFGEWLSGGEKQDSWLMKLCLWIEKRRTRKIKVKIHKYDTWSMDNTLAHIILPMLVQLKAAKHGAPFVDDEDVPEQLRSTQAPPRENESDLDGNHFKRWEWVLDEEIFAFSCLVDDSWQDAFHSGETDHIWVPVDLEGNEVDEKDAKLFRTVDGPNHTYKCDYEGMKVVEARIQNGLRLFGRYYRGLWD